MKVAVYINHPSQYYIFKNIIQQLNKKKILTKVFVKSKDILEELLVRDNYEYKLVYEDKKSKSIIELIRNVIRKNKALYRELRYFKPDMLISCGSDVAQVGFFLNIPRIVFNDDDIGVVPLSACFGWPFASNIFAPESCNMGLWKSKTIAYHGYMKLSYLSPIHFKPDKGILKKYDLHNKRFFIIRSVSLTAHHDINKRGLNNDLIFKLIELLSPFGEVFISCEKKLNTELYQYKLSIDPLDIHHLIYYSSLLVGDSQTMAQEAALLGTPSVRYNDFVSRIGVLNELESKYNLTFGISPNNPDLLFEKVKEIASQDNVNIFKERAKKMASEMINLPSFVAWFIENYPDSERVLMKNPDYQFNFK